MFTNLGVDPKLIREARRLGGHPTKTAAIRAALLEYVQVHKKVRSPAAGTTRRRKRR